MRMNADAFPSHHVVFAGPGIGHGRSSNGDGSGGDGAIHGGDGGGGTELGDMERPVWPGIGRNTSMPLEEGAGSASRPASGKLHRAGSAAAFNTEDEGECPVGGVWEVWVLAFVSGGPISAVSAMDKHTVGMCGDLKCSYFPSLLLVELVSLR